MIKPSVKRGLLLDFIPEQGANFTAKNAVEPQRVFKLNKKEILRGDVYYIMSRDFRVEDNWGIIYAENFAKEYKRKLKVIIYLDLKLYSKHQWAFISDFLRPLKENLEENKIDYEIVERNLTDKVLSVGAVVVDFNPITKNDWQKFAQKIKCACFEVDSHNIIPARFISDKQEYSAATMRKKVYEKIGNFLTEFPGVFKCKVFCKTQAYKKRKKHKKFDKQLILNVCSNCVLDNFIKNKLDNYAELRNDPNADVVSGLSKYLHFGLISAQRVALEVLKSDASRENKEAFLEELIVRKELSDNFCLYAHEFTTFRPIYPWAKETLKEHAGDIRPYVYSLREFEMAQTHDELWNAAQNQLLKEGRIHGYMRMYWAKKILEWSKSPEEALKTAIFLNDEYASDGNSPNGYVGVLWAIGALHDRAFASREVFGKIRYMSANACKSKFDVKKYVKKYSK